MNKASRIPAQESAREHHALGRPFGHVGHEIGNHDGAERVAAKKDGRRRREALRIGRLERGLGR